MHVTREIYDEMIYELMEIMECLSPWEKKFIQKMADTEFFRISCNQMKKIIEIHGAYHSGC